MFSLIRKVSVWASAVKLGRVSPSGGDGRAAAFFYKNLLPQALRSKRGAAALAILAAMYAAAIFAPYSPTEQCLDKSFHPPTKIFFENGSLRAQCYRQSDPSIAQYEPVEGESLPIKFFVRDEKSDCKIFGLIPFKARLFGVDSPEPDARVYLLGADSTGRDVFSRLLYGARVAEHRLCGNRDNHGAGVSHGRARGIFRGAFAVNLGPALQGGSLFRDKEPHHVGAFEQKQFYFLFYSSRISRQAAVCSDDAVAGYYD